MEAPIPEILPQNNPLQEAPPQNVPAQPILSNPIDQLTEAVANFVTASTLHLVSNALGAKTVMHPSPFGGGGGDNVHRFLVSFMMWAMAQGTGLNVIGVQGELISQCNGEWIRVALSLL